MGPVSCSNGTADGQRHGAVRFLTIPQVADELAVSVPQVRALLRGGSLRGIQIGGRRQWRIERAAVEEFIQRGYAAAQGVD